MSFLSRGGFGLQSALNHVARAVHATGKRLHHSGSSFAQGNRSGLWFSPQLETLETREVLSAALGMNIEQVADYSADWKFTDAFKESRPWIRQNYDTVTGATVPDLTIPLDQRTGSPTLLRQFTDPRTGHLLVQQVTTLMFDGIDGHYPNGTYTAWWQGDGTVNWLGVVNQASIQLGTATGADGQQYHSAVFTVNPGLNDGIIMTVTASSASDANPIHDVHVWMPDYNGQHFVGQIWQPGANFSPFHPLFLERLRPFHTLRLMGMQDTSMSSLQHWSGRRDVSSGTQQSGPDDGLTVGQSTGGNTATTLNDSPQIWTANQWVGLTVQITRGTGAGQVRTITANTNNQLALAAAWNVIPDGTSAYAILSPSPQTGRSTGSNTTTTLNDSTQMWTANQWTGLALRITAGTGAGQVRAITGNTVNQLSLGTPWVVLPDNTSTYAIESDPGIAPEYMVELANELRADAWIAIPHMAQDDYVSALATLVHNTLNPNQHVYLEWSNEAWNSAPGFDAFQWVSSQLPANATQDDHANFVAQQVTHVFGIWSQAFSDHPGQLIRVLAGQEGNDFYNGPLLAAMNQRGGTYDAFAVGAYIHAEPFQANTTVDQVLADTSASIPHLISSLQGTRGLVNQSSTQLGRHIAFVAYEGGPGLEAQYFPPQDPTLAQDIRALNQAMIDPRMYSIYTNFLNQLGTTGLELLNHEEYTGRVVLDSGGGLYGALNYQDQPTADAPKYRALIDYLTANGLQFSAATYSVAKNGGTATITVTRGSGDGTITVDYATSNGTAVAGVQYTATSGTLTFAPGETSKTFIIPILNNNLVDGNQTLNLTLSNPTGGGLLSNQNTAVLTIVDSNLPQVPNTPLPANIGQVANLFAHSREHYTDFVTKAYLLYLGRGPDPVGLAGWVNAMATQGLTDERLETAFLSSAEYINNHGGMGRGWVVGLYRDLLGRTPAESEISGWLTALAQGTTGAAVAYSFAASPERESLRVRTYYTSYLGRVASATEVDGWVQALLTGATPEDVVAGFVGSLEFYTNAQKGSSNRAVWVSLAYTQVLFRAPAVSEVNGWLAVLN
jgi:hypothetical protein